MEKVYKEAVPSQVQQAKHKGGTAQMVDNRELSAVQTKMASIVQCAMDDEDELLQGKFAVQREVDEDDVLGAQAAR